MLLISVCHPLCQVLLAWHRGEACPVDEGAAGRPAAPCRGATWPCAAMGSLPALQLRQRSAGGGRSSARPWAPAARPGLRARDVSVPFAGLPGVPALGFDGRPQHRQDRNAAPGWQQFRRGRACCAARGLVRRNGRGRTPRQCRLAGRPPRQVPASTSAAPARRPGMAAMVRARLAPSARSGVDAGVDAGMDAGVASRMRLRAGSRPIHPRRSLPADDCWAGVASCASAFLLSVLPGWCR